MGAFFDYECRLIGARSARLCPAADVMRYFRFGYPAKPRAVPWQGGLRLMDLGLGQIAQPNMVKKKCKKCLNSELWGETAC